MWRRHAVGRPSSQCDNSARIGSCPQLLLNNTCERRLHVNGMNIVRSAHPLTGLGQHEVVYVNGYIDFHASFTRH